MTDLGWLAFAWRDPLTTLWLAGMVIVLTWLALVCLALREELLRRDG